jgi:hypothetical protein
VLHEEGREPAADRRFGGHLLPVRVDRISGCGGLQIAHGADLSQRHADAAQLGDEPGLLQLVRVVEPVARLGIDRGRWQQPQLVVEPQRLRREPSRAGKRPDR